MQILKTYIITFLVFIVLDAIWLGFIAKKLYAEKLGYLMKSNVNWIAAVIFYLIFIAGLVFFVVSPSITKESLSYALKAGLFFGFVTYATYDLTNLATIKDWPLSITFIDLAWGSTLGLLTSTISYLININI